MYFLSASWWSQPHTPILCNLFEGIGSAFQGNVFPRRRLHTADAPSSSSEKNNCLSVCLSYTPSAAAAPGLVHFTINFTITNLAFEEDMSRPGSRKFSITERILQRLVRVLLTAPNTAHRCKPCLPVTQAPGSWWEFCSLHPVPHTGINHTYLSYKPLESRESPDHCT